MTQIKTDPMDPPPRNRYRILRSLCIPVAAAILVWALIVPASDASPADSASVVTLNSLTPAAEVPGEDLANAPDTVAPFRMSEEKSADSLPPDVSNPHIVDAFSGKPQETRITIAGVGDILMHKAVIDGGFTGTSAGEDTYDFSRDFTYVKPILASADLAMCNFEGTLAGPPYSGFPSFSAPDAIADALYDTGFDIVGTANNHCIDKGFDGLKRTASVLRSSGLTVVGTREDLVFPTDALYEINGIKVGVLCYTFETIGSEQTTTINGIVLPKEARDYVDSFNPYRPEQRDQDVADILSRAALLRDQGADIVCLSVHWGEEYQTKSSAWQQDLAQRFCDGGIDIIFGHHPHVLQEAAVLTSAVTGRETVVFYSLGNFLHNMNFGTLGTFGKAQDSAIARVTVVKDGQNVRIEKAEYIPAYVVRVTEDSHTVHRIVPIAEATLRPEDFSTTAQEAEASRKRILAVLGPCRGSASLPIAEAFV